jgi:hypothetical protein
VDEIKYADENMASNPDHFEGIGSTYSLFGGIEQICIKPDTEEKDSSRNIKIERIIDIVNGINPIGMIGGKFSEGNLMLIANNKSGDDVCRRFKLMFDGKGNGIWNAQSESNSIIIRINIIWCDPYSSLTKYSIIIHDHEYLFTLGGKQLRPYSTVRVDGNTCEIAKTELRIDETLFDSLDASIRSVIDKIPDKNAAKTMAYLWNCMIDCDTRRI